MSKGSHLEVDAALKAMLERLIAIFHPGRVYLFSSKARGDSGSDSGYDLLVVVSDSREPGYRQAQKTHRSLIDIPYVADVVVLAREEFESSLPETILREGKPLYAV